MGVDPGPFTWRQLHWMARGRGMLEWNQTALLAMLLHNAHCTDPAKLKTVIDFHPYAPRVSREADVIPGNDISVLKVLIPPESPAHVQ